VHDPDAMSYTITIEDEGRATALKDSDPIASAHFANLLDFVERL
jgi:hypothetical protein